MPLQTETYTLEDEADRLQDQISDLEDLIDDVPEGREDAVQELTAKKQRLELQLAGARWAATEAADAEYCPAWDKDVDEVTLAGLTGGEVKKAQDAISSDAGEGARQVEYIAAGSVHPGDDTLKEHAHLDVPTPAPYVNASPSEQTEAERLSVVGRLPDTYHHWAYARIDELTTVGGNGNLDFDKLREKINAMSPKTSSSTT